DRDHLDADRFEVLADELLGSERGDLGPELDHERLLDPELREQLESPLERREQLDTVPEHLTGVRVEGDHGRAGPRRDRRGDDGAVTDVDAVERPDRDRTRNPFEVGRPPRDLHAPSAARPAARVAPAAPEVPASS